MATRQEAKATARATSTAQGHVQDTDTDALSYLGIPPLTTKVARAASADEIGALRLIADSVAQQRQGASYAVIASPLVLGVYGLVLGVLAHFRYRTVTDLPVFVCTVGGITMAALLAVRWLTGGYLALAEQIGWAWLGRGKDGRTEGEGSDVVIVTKFGHEVIGTVVVRHSRRPYPAVDQRQEAALLRAWTVRLRYRGTGVGRNLLEEAVRLIQAHEKGEREAEVEVEWDPNHASVFHPLSSASLWSVTI